MPTITLQIDDKVSDKFLWFLNHFSQNEVKVINNTSEIEPQKNDLESLGGSLNQYSDSSKLELESKAWELHIMDKYK
jgi:hypothetical protein